MSLQIDTVQAVADGLIGYDKVGGDLQSTSDDVGVRGTLLYCLSLDKAVLPSCSLFWSTRAWPLLHDVCCIKSLIQPNNNRVGDMEPCGHLTHSNTNLQPHYGSCAIKIVELSSWWHDREVHKFALMLLIKAYFEKKKPHEKRHLLHVLQPSDLYEFYSVFATFTFLSLCKVSNFSASKVYSTIHFKNIFWNVPELLK